MNESRCITDQKISFEGQTVLVRAGLNVPIKGGAIASTFRIDKVLRTIAYLQKKGAKIIVVGHIGRDIKDSLSPVYEYSKNMIEDVTFYENYFLSYGTDEFDWNKRFLCNNILESDNGSVHFLDNIRQTADEKNNSSSLNSFLHSLADYYVHEAFPVAHRRHSSTFGTPLLFPVKHKFYGITFSEEIEFLSKMEKPESPSLFILGGAKFETKLPMLKKFSEIYDHTLIGGALANNIFQEMGNEIGTSLVDHLDAETEETIQKYISSEGALVPGVVTCETSDGEILQKKISDVGVNDKILDISKESIDNIKDIIVSCETILWNGPMGYYEGGYVEGSESLANAISESNSISVAGGGDTITAIFNAGKQDTFDFLSTGGGSTIELLSTGTLPGIISMEGE